MRRNIERESANLGDQLAWLILRVIGKLSPCPKTSLIAYVSGDRTSSNSPTGDIIFNAVLRLEGLGFVQVAQEQIAITDEGRRFLDKLPIEALPGCTSRIAYLSALVPASLAAHVRRLNQFCQTCLARARVVAQRGFQMNGGRPWKPDVAVMLGSRATTLVHRLTRDAKVWRALGFSGKRSAESLPDVFGPPLVPPGQSVIAQLDATKIMPLLSAAWNAAIRGQFKLTVLARQHTRSIKLYLRHACPRCSSQFINLGGFPRFMQRRGFLTGVLIVAISLGSVEVAMRIFAIGTQPHLDKTTSAKILDRQITVVEPDTAKAVQTSKPPDASKPLQTSKPAGFKTELGAPEAEVFNVGNIHPTEGFVTSGTHPASAPQQEAVNPTSASQSRTAAEPHLIPLPTKKPQRPTAKGAQSSTAELKRKAPRQGEREPKPMAFGSIGYNYDPQR
jgi:hypothetical protein